MPRVLAWEALWDCPRQRPFWCSHPHCLWCNFDEEDRSAWTLAAFLGPTLPFERYYDPSYPDAHYIHERRYVAWLCEDCAEDLEVVRWFVNRVTRYYPVASIVQSPAAPDEALFTPPPAAPEGPIRTDRIPWSQVPIGSIIRKTPHLI